MRENYIDLNRPLWEAMLYANLTFEIALIAIVTWITLNLSGKVVLA